MEKLSMQNLPVCCGNCVNWYVVGDVELAFERANDETPELFTLLVELI